MDYLCIPDFILKKIIGYFFPLQSSVSIAKDYIDRCKSNYHMIVAQGYLILSIVMY
jgi:hypothetical protein